MHVSAVGYALRYCGRHENSKFSESPKDIDSALYIHCQGVPNLLRNEDDADAANDKHHHNYHHDDTAVLNMKDMCVPLMWHVDKGLLFSTLYSSISAETCPTSLEGSGCDHRSRSKRRLSTFLCCVLRAAAECVFNGLGCRTQENYRCMCMNRCCQAS